MIVAIVTFHLPQPASLAEITKTFQSTAPKYRGMQGLLRKNYFMSEDGASRRRHLCLAITRRRRAALHAPNGNHSCRANTARRRSSNICIRR